MLGTNLEEIDVDDLQQLVANGIPEGKSIEYKSEFYRLSSPDQGDRARQHEEMLKDISSFANTVGGDLIIGVKDKDGVASEVCGFDVSAGVDGIKRQILDNVQKWLEPRVALAIHAVNHSPNRAVFVLRIMRSPIGPHRVIYQGNFGQFWARHSSGTYKMDTDDLRQAFTNSASIEEKIASYRNERIRAVIGNQTPVPLSRPIRMIGHLIPMDAFTSQLSFTVQELLGQSVNYPQFQSTRGWTSLINLDGVVFYDAAGGGIELAGYVYAFRNGIIEFVVDDIIYFSPSDTRKSTPTFKVGCPKEIIRSLQYYLKALRNLHVQPPVWFSLTLTGVKGMYIEMGDIDRNRLELPPVEITDLVNVDCPSLLRPIFDALWNASGHARCFQYDQNGTFRGVVIGIFPKF